MSDIVEELRDRYPETILFTDIKHIAHEAAETIERLREATLRIEGQLATAKRLLAESQAREKERLSMLKRISETAEFPLSFLEGIRLVLCLPFDSTALDAAITKAKREGGVKSLLNAVDHFHAIWPLEPFTIHIRAELRRMADELKGGEQG